MSAGAPAIPRPASARSGGPPPWTGASWPSRLTTEHVRVTLLRPPAALADGPAPVDRTTDSAVVVPLFDAGDGARVVLTRRAATLARHSGQVAFPGGRPEAGETLVEAALREAWEEVGLAAGDVGIVGSLTPVPTVVSGMIVHPFVAVVPPDPLLVPHPGEVDRVFDVGLAELLADGVYREELWPGPAGERSVIFFEVAGETVWGVTAAILRELLTIVVLANGSATGPVGAAG